MARLRALHKENDAPSRLHTFPLALVEGRRARDMCCCVVRCIHTCLLNKCAVARRVRPQSNWDSASERSNDVTNNGGGAPMRRSTCSHRSHLVK